MKTATNAKRKRAKGLLIFLIIAAIIFGFFLDSKYRIITTEYELTYSNLPQSFDGYKVVQLSDLHMMDFGDKLAQTVALQNPDIIVMTGDMINFSDTGESENQTEQIEPLLEDLVHIAPCYYIDGNHEMASRELDKLSALLQKLGITYLRNDYVLIEKESESIVLAGVEDPNGPADMIKPDEFTERIAEKYPDKYIMLLAHRNDYMQKYPDIPVDTILCGHSHGGIVKLPLLGGIFSTTKGLFPKYDSGLFNEGNYDMIISSGLGEHGIIPRFLNNPEIVVVILKKS